MTNIVHNHKRYEDVLDPVNVTEHWPRGRIDTLRRCIARAEELGFLQAGEVVITLKGKTVKFKQLRVDCQFIMAGDFNAHRGQGCVVMLKLNELAALSPRLQEPLKIGPDTDVIPLWFSKFDDVLVRYDVQPSVWAVEITDRNSGDVKNYTIFSTKEKADAYYTIIKGQVRRAAVKEMCIDELPTQKEVVQKYTRGVEIWHPANGVGVGFISIFRDTVQCLCVPVTTDKGVNQCFEEADRIVTLLNREERFKGIRS